MNTSSAPPLTPDTALPLGPPLGKRIAHILEYGLTLVLSLFFGRLCPYTWLEPLSRSLAFLLRPFVPAARRRIMANLEAAFPEMEPDQREALYRKNLAYTLRVSLEVFQSYKFRNPKFVDRYLSAEPEVLAWAGGLTGPRICIQAHFGNWELPVQYFARHSHPVPYSLKHFSNPYVDRWMLRLRRGYGGIPIFMEESKDFLKHLRRGSVIGLVADQDAGPGGVFVQFFGRPASTFPGPALLAIQSQGPIGLITCVYQGKGHYHLTYVPVCAAPHRKDWPNLQTGLSELTQRWVATVEASIRRHPEQYFWIHRRWKSKPAADQTV